jgi:hypothetical protein
MAFSKEIKSNRLLQSRRFTQDALGDSQEAFTRVLDLNASEIYSQQNLIPTSSLPYSGSSQNGAIVTINGEPILKYWHQQRLTPSDTRNSGESSFNTWFFLAPTSSTQLANGVNPGVLLDSQQTNFISPKYAPALGGDTEDTTPGYKVKLTQGGTLVDPATYTFDYKTGVLEFNGQSGYTNIATDIRLSAYQYIGKTLASDAILGYSGSFSGSFEGAATFNDLTLTGSFNHTGSYNQIGDATLTGNTDRTGTLTQDGNLTLTGSFNHTGSQFHIGNTTQTGSVYQTGSIFLTGSIDVVGPIISNGINVVDNAIAMAIALG